MILNFEYEWNGLQLDVEASIENDNLCEGIEVTLNEADFDVSEVYTLSYDSALEFNENNEAVGKHEGVFKGKKPPFGRYIKQSRGNSKNGVYEVVCLYDFLVEVANQKWFEGER